jgi:hypothetical protein
LVCFILFESSGLPSWFKISWPPYTRFRNVNKLSGTQLHDVLKIDTGLAEKSLESLNVNTGCFVPHNLKFTHFTADNIEPICFGVHFLPPQTPYTMSWQTLRILVCFVLLKSSGLSSWFKISWPELTMPNYDPKDNIFLQLVHVALKIRGDLIGMDGHVGLSVSEDDAINCVPDSLLQRSCTLVMKFSQNMLRVCMRNQQGFPFKNRPMKWA